MDSIFWIITGIDHSLLKALNSIAGASPVTDWLVRVGSDDHIVPILLTVLLTCYLLSRQGDHERRKAWTAFLSVVITALASLLLMFFLNELFFRPRPFTSVPTVEMLFYQNTDSAFPSNAAILAFSMSVPLLLFDRRFGSVAVALSVFLGASRVISGVHYPFDIAAAALIATGIAITTYRLEVHLQPAARLLAGLSGHLLSSYKAPCPARKGMTDRNG